MSDESVAVAEPEFDSAAYLLALVKKQRPAVDAAAFIASLDATKKAEIVAAGRAANLGKVNELLG